MAKIPYNRFLPINLRGGCTPCFLFYFLLFFYAAALFPFLAPILKHFYIRDILWRKVPFLTYPYSVEKDGLFSNLEMCWCDRAVQHSAVEQLYVVYDRNC